MDIKITSDVARFRDRFTWAQSQMPFAAAKAATALARQVQDAERAAIPEVFDNPTSFTRNAIGSTGATKNHPVASVFVKERQARYLEPSEVHGLQVLGAGKRIRTPVDIRTNASGDIPRGALARLLPAGQLSTKGPGGYFIGTVHGVNALWQRIDPKKGAKKGGTATSRKLKMLVAFTKPVHVKTNFNFQRRGQRIIEQNAVQVLDKAVLEAMKTAR